MIKKRGDIELLQGLLDKYRFTSPLPPAVQESMLSAKKRVYIRVLKTVGALTALKAILISVYFSLKKSGTALAVIKVVAAAAAAASVSYGAYRAISAYTDEDRFPDAALKEEGREDGDTHQRYNWVDEILLYNGRVIRGAIISRGDVYRIKTSTGVITVPGNRVKTVRPLRVPVQKKDDSHGDK